MMSLNTLGRRAKQVVLNKIFSKIEEFQAETSGERPNIQGLMWGLFWLRVITENYQYFSTLADIHDLHKEIEFHIRHLRFHEDEG